MGDQAVRVPKKDRPWNFEAYLAEQERHLQNADGAHEWAISALNKKGGYGWLHTLAQTDIIGIVVDAVREYDKKRGKPA